MGAHPPIKFLNYAQSIPQATLYTMHLGSLRVLTLTHHMGEGEAMRRLLEPLEGWQEERSRSTIRVLTLTHHMGEGEAMQLEPLEVGLEAMRLEP